MEIFKFSKFFNNTVKKIKYLGKAKNDQQYLYTVNHITLLKEMKEEKVDTYTVFLDWEIEYDYAVYLQNTFGGLKLPSFKTYYKGIVIKTVAKFDK